MLAHGDAVRPQLLQRPAASDCILKRPRDKDLPKRDYKGEGNATGSWQTDFVVKFSKTVTYGNRK